MFIENIQLKKKVAQLGNSLKIQLTLDLVFGRTKSVFDQMFKHFNSSQKLLLAQCIVTNVKFNNQLFVPTSMVLNV